MKFYLLCPVCNSSLKDKFCADRAWIGVGKTFEFTLECTACDKYFDISVIAQVVLVTQTCDTGEAD